MCQSTVFISGMAGMIGSHVAEACLDMGYNVVGLDNLSGGTLLNLPEREHRFIEGNICNFERLERIFSTYKPQYVIHCAAFAAENLSHNCRAFTYQNNLVGTANMVSLAVKYDVECFVNLSSIAVYGHIKPPFYEETKPVPSDPYGVCKFAAEMDLECARQFFGLNYVNFRPHNVIGTRQNMADTTRNVASIFIRQALEGKPLTIFGDGLQTRGFSPVQQVAGIIASSASRVDCYGHTFNVGSDYPITVLALARLILELTGSTSQIQHLEARKETVYAEANHAKVNLFFPIFSNPIGESERLVECLKEMIEEAKSRPMRPLMPMPPLETDKNLPEVWKNQLLP
jgi:UDP-glucose 4-epimerase